MSAEKTKTLTLIEPSMPKQGGCGALSRAAAPCFLMSCLIYVSVRFLSAGMGFSFRVKALRLNFKAFSIRFVYTCSLHIPFMFPCSPPLPDHYLTTIRPLFLFSENHKKSSKIVFSNLLAPWQETFADTRDGDVGSFGTIVGSF